jgi:hypothetical protein
MPEDEREPIEDARGGFDSPDEEPDLREEEREEEDAVTIPAVPPPAH